MTTYTNNDTILDSVKAVTSVTIISSCVTIRGNGPGDYAFILAKDTLENCLFQQGSKLQTIQQYAFYQCSKLKSIDLSVCTELTTLESYAFNTCKSLETVKFPASLQTINARCFTASGLTAVFVPANVRTIGSYCFDACTKLASFEFEENSLIESITDHIVGKTLITSFFIPEFLKTISGSTFEGMHCMTSITIHPNNQYMIKEGDAIFSADRTTICIFPNGISGSYSIPEGITEMASFSFAYSSLTNITFPSTLTTISSYSLTSSAIIELLPPSSCKTIAGYSCASCASLTTVILQEGLMTIQMSAFSRCKNLKLVILPSTLESLGGGVFAGCPEDINITFDQESDLEFDLEKYWITNKLHTYIVQCIGTGSEYIIPKTYQKLLANSFEGLETLISISFEEGSSLTTIESMAFQKCSNLISFSFPPSLITISRYAFYGCSSLKSISLASSPKLITISEYCFALCYSIDSVTLPIKRYSSVAGEVTLGPYAFFNCYSMKTIDFGDSVSVIKDSCFTNCSSITSIVIPSCCSSIGNNAFQNCTNLQSCDLSACSEVNEISTYLFHNCSKLNNIQFPPNVEQIGSYSFSNTAFSKVTIPEKVKTIQRYAFQNCINLITFDIPYGSVLETLEIGVFSGCSQFKEIKNSSPFLTIWNMALFNAAKTDLIILPPASGIKYFSFPENVITVRSSALEQVTSLEVVFIPYSVKTIEEAAFMSCIHLRYINLPASIESIGKNAFSNCYNLQCGLSIENRDLSFLEKLVNTAQLPSRCLKTCPKECKETIIPNKKFSHSIVYVFVFLTRS